MSKSRAEKFALLSNAERLRILNQLSPGANPVQVLQELKYNWEWNARPEQMTPGSPGAAINRLDWVTWLILAGRGFGKTRTGAEYVRQCVCGPTPLVGGTHGRIALIAETASDAGALQISCYG